MKQSASRRRVRGISLIEVLVSMVIGLVVVGAVIVSIVGSGKAGRFQSAYAQMNQDAQIGLSILSRELQMAGYSQPSALVDVSGGGGATPSFALSYNIGTATVVFGCDTGFASPQAATVTCNAAGSAPAFEVVYEADLKNTVPTGGVPSDCLGNAIAGAAPYLAHNRFYVATGTSGRPELYCASTTAAQPLLENVEAMRIWYGVQIPATPPSRQVARYVSATDINGVGATEWSNVISVRICLLMRSSDPVLEAGGEDTLTYLDCGSVQQTSNDRYLRRAYFTTSTLRSKMPF